MPLSPIIWLPSASPGASDRTFQLEIGAHSASFSPLDRHHDLGPDSAILSRFLSRETALHCAVVVAPAGRAQLAFHQRRYEPVRADLSRATKAALESATRGRHPEMHSCRREA